MTDVADRVHLDKTADKKTPQKYFTIKEICLFSGFSHNSGNTFVSQEGLTESRLMVT